MEAERDLQHLLSWISLLFLLEFSLLKSDHFSSQGKTTEKLRAPTVIMGYLVTGFFLRMDVLVLYTKGHSDLIYLIEHNMSFEIINPVIAGFPS